VSRRPRKLTRGDGWSLVGTCSGCGRPETECRCEETPGTAATAAALVRLRVAKRRGKPVTILAASGIDGAAFKDLVRELKTSCAAGGSVKDLEAILQGDHRARIRRILEARGIPVKG